jgi:hypothetical protein
MTWTEFIAALADPVVALLALTGFVSQLFDGSIGMGFGAVSSTVMAVLGVPRDVASATVNGAKIFTGTASGFAHLLQRNVNGRLLLRLGLAGGLGGFVGAQLLAYRNGQWVGIAISCYLLGVGIYILWRAAADLAARPGERFGSGIGFAGGLLEALAGVWGPIVTSNLVAASATPRYAIGTGNVAETFVAGVVFATLVPHVAWTEIAPTAAGLLAGAILATPLAARITRRLPQRTLTFCVGALVIVLSGIRLARDFFG